MFQSNMGFCVFCVSFVALSLFSFNFLFSFYGLLVLVGCFGVFCGFFGGFYRLLMWFWISWMRLGLWYSIVVIFGRSFRSYVIMMAWWSCRVMVVVMSALWLIISVSSVLVMVCLGGVCSSFLSASSIMWVVWFIFVCLCFYYVSF